MGQGRINFGHVSHLPHCDRTVRGTGESILDILVIGHIVTGLYGAREN